MYKYYLFLYVIIAFLSCSKDGDEYDTHSCRVEIKEGSSFLLYTKLGNPVEELVFEKNTILFGKKIFFSDKNQCLYQIDYVNKYFKKSKVDFDDLNITIVNDSIRWIDNSSEANFYFDNIDYFTVNDSICHFRCYGEKRSHIFFYSGYDTVIRIKADISINLINN
ncbi:hypothetical protein [Parabacteroides sp.]